MGYTAPDADDLKTKFPAFAAIGDDVIEPALGEAALMVDDSWLSQADFTLGQLLYAAHVLTLAGVGASTEAQFAGFRRLQIESLSLERDSSAVPAGQLESTSFGQQFAVLLKRNRPGPIAV